MTDISLTNVYGLNVLHIAARFNHHDILKVLLADERIDKIKDSTDLIGRTALDIAIENRADDCIQQLTNRPLTKIQT